MDLIDRQAAIDALNELSEHYTEKGREWHPHINFVIDTINELPSAESERKKGNWVGIDDEPCTVFECDVCGYTWEDIDGDTPNYCPNCGAEMKGEDDAEIH